jgi:hypothetical protein
MMMMINDFSAAGLRILTESIDKKQVLMFLFLSLIKNSCFQDLARFFAE